MIYLKQLLAGRHYARVNPIAGQMANFAYLIGDAGTKECYAVDPSWDPRGILQIAEEEGMKVVGVIATHHHADHVGGGIFGMEIDGVKTIVDQRGVSVWVHEEDAQELERGTGVPGERIVRVRDGDTLQVGDETIGFLHTPGHTAGSMCVRIGNALLTGDTLFVGACGRVDLPGSSPRKMHNSLTVTLRSLPDELEVWPGHDYGPKPSSTIGEEKRHNAFMRPGSFSDWDRLE